MLLTKFVTINILKNPEKSRWDKKYFFFNLNYFYK